ncbi:MAG: AsmA family protein, partial [Limnohabitans sp.]|nr:AsmA family protein [Limnohabitans sp.]
MKIQKLKIVKIILISIITILAILILIPVIFEEKITQKVKEIANQNLNAKLEFSHSKVSFFTHFPSLTLTLTQFDLKGSKPYQNESLLKSDKVGFGINFLSIFSNKIKIEEIYLSNSQITILVNKNGEANYNIYKSKESQEKSESDNSIQIENISIENSALNYIDHSSNIKFLSKGLNYIGK